MSDRTQSTAGQALVAAATPDEKLIPVLQQSLYPGARPASIMLVLAWCKATGRDPMKKPIHIVPMWVKDAITGKGEMRDVLMPGIGTYRSDAANTGQYAGKTEPEFGPDIDESVGTVKMKYPEWCRVTVKRLVAGQVRDFTAKERWLENYATAGKDTENPNAMWKKRPYGQLAKVAESQALRMAFPDETGNTNTTEEMEGKTFVGMTIEQPASFDYAAAEAAAPVERDPRMVQWTDEAVAFIAGMATAKQLDGYLAKITANMNALAESAPELSDRIGAAIEAADARFQAAPAPTADPQPAAPPEPTQAPTAPTFYAIDDMGEPIIDDVGVMLEFADPASFAAWFDMAAAGTNNIEALFENNADAIGDCRGDAGATKTIMDALANARARFTETNASAGQSTPLPMPKLQNGRPDWVAYYKAAGAEIAALSTTDAVEAWVALNQPVYGIGATAIKVDTMVRERMKVLAPPPADDPDQAFHDKTVADFEACNTVDELIMLSRNPMIVRRRAEIKETRPDLWDSINDAGTKRRAELAT